MTISLTRREASRLARREAILEIARDVFLERGFAGTSMSEIAQLVGGSKATFWSYFSSKETLFGAVVERATDELNRVLEGSFRAGADLHQTLSDFAIRFTTELTSPFAIRFVRLVAAELERFPSLGPVFYEDGMYRIVERLSRYLKDEMASGRLRKDDSQLAAQQFCALLQHHTNMSIWYGQVASQQTAKAYGEAAVDMFLRAYRPRARSARAAAGVLIAKSPPFQGFADRGG